MKGPQPCLWVSGARCMFSATRCGGPMRPTYRLIPLLALAGLAACAERSTLDPQPDVAFGVRGNGAKQIAVMSRNMYIGADVDPVLQAIVGGNPADALAALQVALGQIQR